MIATTLIGLWVFLSNRAQHVNQLHAVNEMAKTLVSDRATTSPLSFRTLSDQITHQLMEPGTVDLVTASRHDYERLVMPSRGVTQNAKLKLDDAHQRHPLPKTDISLPLPQVESSRRNGDLSHHFVGENPFTKYHVDILSKSPNHIVLTFDGDHLANCVQPILKVLREKNVQATMFLTGQFVEQYAEETLQIIRDGHEVGNHTWSHRHLTQYESNQTHRTLGDVDQRLVASELRRTNTAFGNLAGQRMKPFWRAPYGEHNKDIRTWAYAEGFLHIGWSHGFDSLDWLDNPKSRYYWRPAALKSRLLRKLGSEPGGKIILFHLGSRRPDEDRPYHMLAEFIDDARARGYRFSTISESLDEIMGHRDVSLAVRFDGLPVGSDGR